MSKRDVVSWNAMVAGYALHEIYTKTINFILQMQKEGINLNSSTIVSILPLIGQEKALKQGKTIHGFCVRKLPDNKDVMVQTALLDMYAKCDYFSYARKIFDRMALKNEVTWSAMIGGYVLSERTSEALSLLNQVFLEGSTNLSHTTLASVLCSCAKLGDLNMGKQMHSVMVKLAFMSDLTSANSLLSMYAKTSQINQAFNLFDEMIIKDTVSHSALISGCVQNGHAEKALDIFRKMKNDKIKPDGMTMVGIIPACAHMAALQHGKCAHAYIIISGLASEAMLCNSLIDMYAKCGRIELARKVFDRMYKRDVISWNTMILGYGIHGLGKEAISLFCEMKNGFNLMCERGVLCSVRVESTRILNWEKKFLEGSRRLDTRARATLSFCPIYSVLLVDLMKRHESELFRGIRVLERVLVVVRLKLRGFYMHLLVETECIQI
ncbi:hypothetical protein LUZ60_015530 [Juncus effusus]|nr:hypothetical protein LUZ60_015530 [Juncus effusus]